MPHPGGQERGPDAEAVEHLQKAERDDEVADGHRRDEEEPQQHRPRQPHAGQRMGREEPQHQRDGRGDDGKNRRVDEGRHQRPVAQHLRIPVERDAPERRHRQAAVLEGEDDEHGDRQEDEAVGGGEVEPGKGAERLHIRSSLTQRAQAR